MSDWWGLRCEDDVGKHIPVYEDLSVFGGKKSSSLQHREVSCNLEERKLEQVARRRLHSERDQQLFHSVSGETPVSLF